jgi:N-acetylneuraminic acid mutarotase
MPDGRNHLMSTAYNGRLYVFGGAQSGSGQATRTTWVYDPAKDTWTVLAPMPEARAAGAAVALGDYLYVIGGVGSTQALLRYDPAANTWKTLAALKAAREHTAAVALDGKIYALAGRWNNAILTSVEIYEPEKDSWTPGTAMNEGRSGFGAAILDGKIVVAGGEVFSASGASALTSAEIYDPDTEKWIFLPPMPVGVHGNPVASYEGEIFVLGGSDRAAGIDNRGRVLVYVP